MSGGRNLDWLAGFFEGEACFYVARPVTKKTLKDGTTKEYPHVHAAISVVSTDQDALDKAANIVGHGNVRGPHWNKKSTVPYYRWWLGGKRAVSLMQELWPLMCKRRQGKITEILEETERT